MNDKNAPYARLDEARRYADAIGMINIADKTAEERADISRRYHEAQAEVMRLWGELAAYQAD